MNLLILFILNEMSLTNSGKLLLSKAELETLVASDDRVISFKNPTNKRNECWTNYSQIYHANSLQDYIISLWCKSIQKWAKDHGTTVMAHHNCLKK